MRPAANAAASPAPEEVDPAAPDGATRVLIQHEPRESDPADAAVGRPLRPLGLDEGQGAWREEPRVRRDGAAGRRAPQAPSGGPGSGGRRRRTRCAGERAPAGPDGCGATREWPASTWPRVARDPRRSEAPMARYGRPFARRSQRGARGRRGTAACRSCTSMKNRSTGSRAHASSSPRPARRPASISARRQYGTRRRPSRRPNSRSPR